MFLSLQNFLSESLKHLDKMYPGNGTGGGSVTSSQNAGGTGGMDVKPVKEMSGNGQDMGKK